MLDIDKKTIKENIDNIRSELSSDVTLLAATKTVDPERINYATKCGITVIGENKVQELLDKYDSIDKSDIQIHFIGHLQSNKVKYIIDKVSLIHSVDSEKLAAEIDKQAKKHGIVMPVLIEINIGDENSKSGIRAENLFDFAFTLSKYDNIIIKGLMTIPPADADLHATEKYFLEMKQLFQKLKDLEYDNLRAEILSMGMTNDYNIADKCGSTLVRVGTGIFGKRDYNK